MSTPIILAGVIASWPILWLIYGSAAVVIIALTAVVALATSPRHHAGHTRHAAHRAGTASVPHETVASDRHALV
jgi:hypothetical protein